LKKVVEGGKFERRKIEGWNGNGGKVKRDAKGREMEKDTGK